MGSDKADLRLPSGETLLEHSLALLASVVPEVRLVGSRTRFAQLAWSGEIVEDIYPGQGPLAGIHAALVSSPSDLNLVFAVDMPSMTPDCLRFLVNRAAESKAIVAVPEIATRLQPLCAVYRRSFAAVAENAIQQGRNKVDAAFDPLTTLVIPQSEFISNGFAVELFRNVNTPQDWAEFQDPASR